MKKLAYFIQRTIFTVFMQQFNSFYSPFRFHKN